MTLLLFTHSLESQSISAADIISKSEDNHRGENNYAEIKMSIIRPDWTREMSIRTWAKGKELALIQVTAPARDRGIAYLKRSKDIWNWQPKIERTVKLPPSMMSQSWLGSDFTNDDLIRESSLSRDYNARLIGEENVAGLDAYHLELVPGAEAAVVWGKILIWISKKDYMQLRAQFYDEDGFLVNTMTGSDYKEFGNRRLPSKIVVVPEDKEGYQTIIEYRTLSFDLKIKDEIFTLQNMKNMN